jgi:hypothetical protein
VALWFPNRQLALVAIVNEEKSNVDAISHAALDLLLK